MKGYGNNFESEVLFVRESQYVTDRITYDQYVTPTIYLTEEAYGQQTAETQTVHRQGTRRDDKRNNTGEPRTRTHTAEESQVQSVRTPDLENVEMQSALSAGNSEGDNHGEGVLQRVQAEVSTKTSSEGFNKQYKNMSRWLKRVNSKEEQSFDSVDEDKAQKQSRKYLYGNDDTYSTNGVHWGIEQGVITKKEARTVWEAIAKIEKLGYNSYPKTMYGDSFIESDNFLMVVNTDYHNPSVKTIYKFNDTYETNMAIAKERLINAKGNAAWNREALQIIEAVFGEGYVEQYDFKNSRTYERQDGRRKGNDSGEYASGTTIREQHFDEQEQQRTTTLTDREVLAMAADKPAERDLPK